MSINLGRESFPDDILTAPLADVHAMLLQRAQKATLQDRTAKEAIADWMEDLRAMRPDLAAPKKAKGRKAR